MLADEEKEFVKMKVVSHGKLFVRPITKLCTLQPLNNWGNWVCQLLLSGYLEINGDSLIGEAVLRCNW